VSACDNGDDGAEPGMTGTPEPVVTTTLERTATTTPEPVVTTTSSSGCADGWTTFQSSGLAICHPPNHSASVSSPTPDSQYIVVRLVAGEPDAQTPYTLTIWWEEGALTVECIFEAEAPDPSATTEISSFELLGVTIDACTATTDYAIQFKGTVPHDADTLRFTAYAEDQKQLELAKQMLRTLRVVDR
jgi:hypothetical protein